MRKLTFVLLLLLLITLIGSPMVSLATSKDRSEWARRHDAQRERIVQQYQLPDRTTDLERIWGDILRHPEQHVGKYVLVYVYLKRSPSGLRAETPLPHGYPNHWPIAFDTTRTTPWAHELGNECLVQVLGPTKALLADGRKAKTAHVKEIECLESLFD